MLDNSHVLDETPVGQVGGAHKTTVQCRACNGLQHASVPVCICCHGIGPVDTDCLAISATADFII